MTLLTDARPTGGLSLKYAMYNSMTTKIIRNITNGHYKEPCHEKKSDCFSTQSLVSMRGRIKINPSSIQTIYPISLILNI